MFAHDHLTTMMSDMQVWHKLEKDQEYWLVRNEYGFAVQWFTSMEEAFTSDVVQNNLGSWVQHWPASNVEYEFTHRIRMNSAGDIDHHNARFYASPPMPRKSAEAFLAKQAHVCNRASIVMVYRSGKCI